jgi:signal transduction histidine kinase
MESLSLDTTEINKEASDTERRYHEILALSRVSAALSGLFDLDAILNVALANVLDIMNGSIGGILLVDEKTDTLYYRVHRGLSPRYVQELRPRMGEGIAGEVARNGKAILLEDISKDPRVQYPDLVSAEGLKAFISVPLRAREKVLGVLNVASRLPRRFTTNDMHMLYSIGDQLGVAIEQTRLKERLKTGRAEIAKLEEEKTRFLSFVGMAAHDLKAPLTAIQSYLWVILGGYSGPINEKQKNMLERCSVRITELMTLISDILDIPRIEAGQDLQEMGEVSLPQIIKKCCDDLGNMIREKGIQLLIEVPESLPAVNGSVTRLQQVVTNLVSNAVSYNVSGGGVTIRAKEKESSITVEVMDTGIGIPHKDLPRIFDEFFRASNNLESKGTGLGLAITRRIVQAHGGKMWVESPCSETGKGTKFSFSLPR